MSRLTENLNLQRALLRHLDSLPNSTVVQDKSKVIKIEQEDSPSGWPLVHLDSEQVFRTRLLVSGCSS